VRRCRKYGINLRTPIRARGIKGLNKRILNKLYITEQKTITEIAGIFDCAISTISKRIKQFGLKKRWKVA